jgi:hypoxanthine phosphoribosyltransferase
MIPAEVVLSRENIAKRTKELGRQITSACSGQTLVLIGVLNGAFIFLADLARAIDLDLEIDFIRIKSYGSSTRPGDILLSREPKLNLNDKNIILVEDIVDTGATMLWLCRYFKKHNPRSLKVCTLIDKPERRTEQITIDYSGFKIKDGFLIGYGLDYAGRFRNLPDIHRGEE